MSEQIVEIEDDVTCLVGKNESGKTTILQAVHRLKPANSRDSKFDLVTEYPRWRLARDRKADNLESFQPTVAEFVLEDEDLTACATFLPARPPLGTQVIVGKSYEGKATCRLQCSLDLQLREAANVAELEEKDAAPLVAVKTREEAIASARATAKTLNEAGEKLRAKTHTAFASAADTLKYLSQALTQEQLDPLWKLVPSFFYFSDVDILPGEHDLTALASKIEAQTKLDAEDESVLPCSATQTLHLRTSSGRTTTSGRPSYKHQPWISLARSSTSGCRTATSKSISTPSLKKSGPTQTGRRSCTASSKC